MRNAVACRAERGSTLIEVLVGASLFLLLAFGFVALLVATLSSFRRDEAQTDVSANTALAMRRVTLTLRHALINPATDIGAGGRSLRYTLPQQDANGDFVFPLRSDNVVRTIQVVNGNLVSSEQARPLLRNVAATDPDPQSATFGQSYPIFQPATTGTLDMLTIRLYTQVDHGRGRAFSRLKNSVILRNSRR